METPKFGFWNNPVTHAVAVFLCYAIPWFIATQPGIASLTVGAILSGVVKLLSNNALARGVKAGNLRVG